VSLCIFKLFVLDSQTPFAVFGKTMETNEFIFAPVRTAGARSVHLARRIQSFFCDKLLGMLICCRLSVMAMEALLFGSLRVHFHFCVLAYWFAKNGTT
jgi:hypothetical protein